MSRSTLASLALVALFVLTGITWRLADSAASVIAFVAGVKILIIGLVFLDLDRAWPGWAAVAAVLVGGVLGGAALLIAG